MHGYSDDDSSLGIDGMLGFVGQVGPPILHLRGPAKSAPGALLSAAADRLFRRLGRRTCDCGACRGFVCPARVSRVGVAGGAARPFDDLSHASFDRSGDARSRLHLDAAATRRRRIGERQTVGIDATTLEANAAPRSIVRRDTGESYQDFLTKLAQASGIDLRMPLSCAHRHWRQWSTRDRSRRSLIHGFTRGCLGRSYPRVGRLPLPVSAAARHRSDGKPARNARISRSTSASWVIQR